jgi:chemotaxis protein MotB
MSETDVEPVPSGELLLEPEEEKPEDCPECKSGAPAWMATFADMATLLMAFFVLILSFADTEVPKFNQINGSMKMAFGIKKITPTIRIPSGRSVMVEEFTPAVAAPTVVKSKTQMAKNPSAKLIQKKTSDEAEDFEIEKAFRNVEAALAEEIEGGQVTVRLKDDKVVVELRSESSAGGAGGEDQSKVSTGAVSQQTLDIAAKVATIQSTTAAEVQLFAGATAEAAASNGQGASSDSGRGAESGGVAQAVSVDTRLEKIRLELDQQINQGLVAVEKVGDAIMIRLEGQGSFVSGSADLQPQFMSLLARVGRTVSDSTGGIRIEGHTDNVPIAFSDRFKSNWDLSAARSASVASYITGSGIDQDRVTVAGFADTRPLEANDTPAGRAKNRRIEIIVEG